MIKASVIIPTYKPQDYICECLDSVLKQSFPPEDYEVIIVLNGCSEPYLSMLKDYIELNATPSHNIRLLHTGYGNVSNARNMGLDAAHGDYILFIDDDDYISSTYIQGLMSLASPDSIVASKLCLFDEVTHTEIHTPLTQAYDVACKHISHKPLTLYSGRRLLSTVWGKIIPKNIVREHRFNTRFALGEDSLFIAALTKYLCEIRIAPADAIYYVRKRGDSASRKPIDTYSQISNAFALAWRYTCMYLSDVRHNDVKFYASRIVASLLKAINKKYRAV